jgi:hypothetical protein
MLFGFEIDFASDFKIILIEERFIILFFEKIISPLLKKNIFRESMLSSHYYSE